MRVWGTTTTTTLLCVTLVVGGWAPNSRQGATAFSSSSTTVRITRRKSSDQSSSLEWAEPAAWTRRTVASTLVQQRQRNKRRRGTRFDRSVTRWAHEDSNQPTIVDDDDDDDLEVRPIPSAWNKAWHYDTPQPSPYSSPVVTPPPLSQRAKSTKASSSSKSSSSSTTTTTKPLPDNPATRAAAAASLNRFQQELLKQGQWLQTQMAHVTSSDTNNQNPTKSTVVLASRIRGIQTQVQSMVFQLEQPPAAITTGTATVEWWRRRGEQLYDMARHMDALQQQFGALTGTTVSQDSGSSSTSTKATTTSTTTTAQDVSDTRSSRGSTSASTTTSTSATTSTPPESELESTPPPPASVDDELQELGQLSQDWEKSFFEAASQSLLSDRFKTDTNNNNNNDGVSSSASFLLPADDMDQSTASRTSDIEWKDASPPPPPLPEPLERLGELQTELDALVDSLNQIMFQDDQDDDDNALEGKEERKLPQGDLSSMTRDDSNDNGSEPFTTRKGPRPMRDDSDNGGGGGSGELEASSSRSEQQQQQQPQDMVVLESATTTTTQQEQPSLMTTMANALETAATAFWYPSKTNATTTEAAVPTTKDPVTTAAPQWPSEQQYAPLSSNDNNNNNKTTVASKTTRLLEQDTVPVNDRPNDHDDEQQDSPVMDYAGLVNTTNEQWIPHPPDTPPTRQDLQRAMSSSLSPTEGAVSMDQHVANDDQDQEPRPPEEPVAWTMPQTETSTLDSSAVPSPLVTPVEPTMEARETDTLAVDSMAVPDPMATPVEPTMGATERATETDTSAVDSMTVQDPMATPVEPTMEAPMATPVEPTMEARETDSLAVDPTAVSAVPDPMKPLEPTIEATPTTTEATNSPSKASTSRDEATASSWTPKRSGSSTTTQKANVNPAFGGFWDDVTHWPGVEDTNDNEEPKPQEQQQQQAGLFPSFSFLSNGFASGGRIKNNATTAQANGESTTEVKQPGSMSSSSTFSSSLPKGASSSSKPSNKFELPKMTMSMLTNIKDSVLSNLPSNRNKKDTKEKPQQEEKNAVTEMEMPEDDPIPLRTDDVATSSTRRTEAAMEVPAMKIPGIEGQDDTRATPYLNSNPMGQPSARNPGVDTQPIDATQRMEQSQELSSSPWKQPLQDIATETSSMPSMNTLQPSEAQEPRRAEPWQPAPQTPETTNVVSREETQGKGPQDPPWQPSQDWNQERTNEVSPLQDGRPTVPQDQVGQQQQPWQPPQAWNREPPNMPLPPEKTQPQQQQVAQQQPWQPPQNWNSETSSSTPSPVENASPEQMAKQPPWQPPQNWNRETPTTATGNTQQDVSQEQLAQQQPWQRPQSWEPPRTEDAKRSVPQEQISQQPPWQPPQNWEPPRTETVPQQQPWQPPQTWNREMPKTSMRDMNEGQPWPQEDSGRGLDGITRETFNQDQLVRPRPDQAQNLQKQWSGSSIASGAQMLVKRPRQWERVQDWVRRSKLPKQWAAMRLYATERQSLDPTSDRSIATIMTTPPPPQVFPRTKMRVPQRWATVKAWGVATAAEESGVVDLSSLPKQWAILQQWTILEYILNTLGDTLGQESSADSTSAEQTILPDRYQVVMYWAQRQKVTPSMNQLLFLLRCQKVAQTAMFGKSRWGLPEVQRAIDVTTDMWHDEEMDRDRMIDSNGQMTTARTITLSGDDRDNAHFGEQSSPMETSTNSFTQRTELPQTQDTLDEAQAFSTMEEVTRDWTSFSQRNKDQPGASISYSPWKESHETREHDNVPMDETSNTETPSFQTDRSVFASNEISQQYTSDLANLSTSSKEMEGSLPMVSNDSIPASSSDVPPNLPDTPANSLSDGPTVNRVKEENLSSYSEKMQPERAPSLEVSSIQGPQSELKAPLSGSSSPSSWNHEQVASDIKAAGRSGDDVDDPSPPFPRQSVQPTNYEDSPTKSEKLHMNPEGRTTKSFSKNTQSTDEGSSLRVGDSISKPVKSAERMNRYVSPDERTTTNATRAVATTGSPSKTPEDDEIVARATRRGENEVPVSSETGSGKTTIKRREFPSLKDIGTSMISQDPVSPGPSQKMENDLSLFDLRNMNVASAAAAGRSRWGDSENRKVMAMALMTARNSQSKMGDIAAIEQWKKLEEKEASRSQSPEAFGVSPESVDDKGIIPDPSETTANTPFMWYLERTIKVARAASVGKSRWGSTENGKAQKMAEAMANGNIRYQPGQNTVPDIDPSLQIGKADGGSTEISRGAPLRLMHGKLGPAESAEDKQMKRITLDAIARGQKRHEIPSTSTSQTMSNVNAKRRGSSSGVLRGANSIKQSSGHQGAVVSTGSRMPSSSTHGSRMPSSSTTPRGETEVRKFGSTVAPWSFMDVNSKDETSKQGRSSPFLYHRRSMKVAKAATAGKSRWGPSENDIAQQVSKASIAAGIESIPPPSETSRGDDKISPTRPKRFVVGMSKKSSDDVSVPSDPTSARNLPDELSSMSQNKGSDGETLSNQPVLPHIPEKKEKSTIDLDSVSVTSQMRAQPVSTNSDEKNLPGSVAAVTTTAEARSQSQSILPTEPSQSDEMKIQRSSNDSDGYKSTLSSYEHGQMAQGMEQAGKDIDGGNDPSPFFPSPQISEAVSKDRKRQIEASSVRPQSTNPDSSVDPVKNSEGEENGKPTWSWAGLMSYSPWSKSADQAQGMKQDDDISLTDSRPTTNKPEPESSSGNNYSPWSGNWKQAQDPKEEKRSSATDLSPSADETKKQSSSDSKYSPWSGNWKQAQDPKEEKRPSATDLSPSTDETKPESSTENKYSPWSGNWKQLQDPRDDKGLSVTAKSLSTDEMKPESSSGNKSSPWSRTSWMQPQDLKEDKDTSITNSRPTTDETKPESSSDSNYSPWSGNWKQAQDPKEEKRPSATDLSPSADETKKQSSSDSKYSPWSGNWKQAQDPKEEKRPSATDLSPSTDETKPESSTENKYSPWSGNWKQLQDPRDDKGLSETAKSPSTDETKPESSSGNKSSPWSRTSWMQPQDLNEDKDTSITNSRPTTDETKPESPSDSKYSPWSGNWKQAQDPKEERRPSATDLSPSADETKPESSSDSKYSPWSGNWKQAQDRKEEKRLSATDLSPSTDETKPESSSGHESSPWSRPSWMQPQDLKEDKDTSLANRRPNTDETKPESSSGNKYSPWSGNWKQAQDPKEEKRSAATDLSPSADETKPESSSENKYSPWSGLWKQAQKSKEDEDRLFTDNPPITQQETKPDSSSGNRDTGSTVPIPAASPMTLSDENGASSSVHNAEINQGLSASQMNTEQLARDFAAMGQTAQDSEDPSPRFPDLSAYVQRVSSSELKSGDAADIGENGGKEKWSFSAEPTTGAASSSSAFNQIGQDWASRNQDKDDERLGSQSQNTLFPPSTSRGPPGVNEIKESSTVPPHTSNHNEIPGDVPSLSEPRSDASDRPTNEENRKPQSQTGFNFPWFGSKPTEDQNENTKAPSFDWEMDGRTPQTTVEGLSSDPSNNGVDLNPPTPSSSMSGGQYVPPQSVVSDNTVSNTQQDESTGSIRWTFSFPSWSGSQNQAQPQARGDTGQTKESEKTSNLSSPPLDTDTAPEAWKQNSSSTESTSFPSGLASQTNLSDKQRIGGSVASNGPEVSSAQAPSYGEQLAREWASMNKNTKESNVATPPFMETWATEKRDVQSTQQGYPSVSMDQWAKEWTGMNSEQMTEKVNEMPNRPPTDNFSSSSGVSTPKAKSNSKPDQDATSVPSPPPGNTGSSLPQSQRVWMDQLAQEWINLNAERKIPEPATYSRIDSNAQHEAKEHEPPVDENEDDELDTFVDPVELDTSLYTSTSSMERFAREWVDMNRESDAFDVMSVPLKDPFSSESSMPSSESSISVNEEQDEGFVDTEAESKSLDESMSKTSYTEESDQDATGGVPPSDHVEPERLPDSYETVLEWAAREPVPPTVNQVIFHLRNHKVASYAAQGKSRWGILENLRANYWVSAVRGALGSSSEEESASGT